MRFLADEDFDNRIIRGVLRRLPQIDIIRVQDSPVAGAADGVILDWAVKEDRILLTHDVTTMTFHALERLKTGLPLAGVFLIAQSLPIGVAIDEKY